MPSLKEIKTRIASVNNTRKITSAMKMVASSKLHRAQRMIENMLPYENLLEHMLKYFLASLSQHDSVFTRKPEKLERVALIVFSSNSSLCGGFNVNVLKMMQQVIEDYQKRGVKEIIVYPIGRKVAERVKKINLKSAGDFTKLADHPLHQDCATIAQQLTKQFVEGQIDKIEMIYHHFISAGSQVLQKKTFLPIDLSTELEPTINRDLKTIETNAKVQEYMKAHGINMHDNNHLEKPTFHDDYIVEPDINTIFQKLIPKELNLMLYTALLDSNASEHAARMVAMQTATDNADKLLKELKLQYNKSRQQAITSELLDIVGGTINN